MQNHVKLALIFIFLPLVISIPAAASATSHDATQAGQQLNIVVQALSHLSGCVQMSIVARGDGIPFLINITYASTGKLMSNGTVQVHFANGKLLNARYSASSRLWTTLYLVPWDHPTGPLDYYVTANSADGAVGFWRPILPYGLITIVPASLHVVAAALNEKTNEPIYAAAQGTIVKIVATVALPLPGEGFPTQGKEETPQVDGGGRLLNSTTMSKVEAVVGQGTFNATTGKFSNYTASTIPLTYDTASSHWTGSYAFKQSDPSGLYQIVVVAADRSSSPNTSFSFTNTLTLGAQSVGGIDAGTVYVVSFGMIIVGFVAGLAVIYRFALPKRKGD